MAILIVASLRAFNHCLPNFIVKLILSFFVRKGLIWIKRSIDIDDDFWTFAKFRFVIGGSHCKTWHIQLHREVHASVRERANFSVVRPNMGLRIDGNDLF